MEANFGFMPIFLVPSSIQKVTSHSSTPKSCMLTAYEAEQLKRFVKDLSVKKGVHPNSVWAELRTKYGFFKFSRISCSTFEEISRDLNLNEYTLLMQDIVPD